MTILTMCKKNFKKFWCYAVFLLVVSLSKSEQSITSKKEKNNNLTIQYEPFDSTTNYDDKIKTLFNDSYEKSTINTQYNNMQYESRMTSMSNDDDSIRYKLNTPPVRNHMDDKQISIKFKTNSTNANYKRNFTSQEIYGNLMNIEDNNNSMSHEIFENPSKISNISNIVSYETCQHNNVTCIQLCCPFGAHMDSYNKCIPGKIKYIFPNVYEYTNNLLQTKNITVDELFQLTIYDPCKEYRRFLPLNHRYGYRFFTNGSLYLPIFQIFATSTYCLAITEEDKFEVTFCLETLDRIKNKRIEIEINNSMLNNIKIINVSFHAVSVLFLVSTFVVYSILPDLRNVHAFMLRNYCGTLSASYILHIISLSTKADAVEYPICITVAFFSYFFYLTSYFWLNMMSFEIWRTFRNVGHRENKKLIYYAIYAWGVPFILAVISIIMDVVSKNLPEILRPGFREGHCWFSGKGPFLLYYYGIKSICTISSICFSISTAVNIARYEKNTGHRLTDSESKRYNNNKKWFNLYLKLFIMLFIIIGIKWSVITVTWWSGDILSNTASYIINSMDIIQNFCTFVIFVWKKKIKLMLLKRFKCDIFPKALCPTIATSSNASTCSTTSEEIPMEKKMSSSGPKNHHTKNSSNGTEL